MKRDDWTTIILAIATALGSAGAVLVAGGSWQNAAGVAFATFAGYYLEALRKRAVVNDQKTDIAAGKADIAAGKAEAAARVAAETGNAVNGRLEQLLREATELAYARGKAAGIATVATGVAESKSINLDARAVAQIVADASKPDVPSKGT